MLRDVSNRRLISYTSTTWRVSLKWW